MKAAALAKIKKKSSDSALAKAKRMTDIFF
jgi:hypothetical protein